MTAKVLELVKHHVLRVVVIAVSASLAFAMTGAGPASGTPMQIAPFAAQVHKAGLSSAQARQLQADVDRYLAEFGGTQVAANEISLGPAARILVALPGERHARSLTAARPEPQGCPYLWFCAYHDPNFEGTEIRATLCGNTNAKPMPWGGWGSWQNNQTPGTRPVLWNCQGGMHDWLPGAYSSNSYYNWLPVCYIQPC